MKQKFQSHRFGKDSLKMIDLCNQIVVGYQAQGLRLTLRQLYYQLVTRNAVPNTERSYKNIGNLLSEARLAGLVDWEAIEDRIRVPRFPTEFNDLNAVVDAALYSYRLPRWRGQAHYVELWVEKDALSGVLAPLAREFHVPLLVNRGYSSQSAMYDSGDRFKDHGGKRCILFYLGDHDPSGEDMVRDIQDRLTMFGANVKVRKLALTMAQVQQYNPPPNPAKDHGRPLRRVRGQTRQRVVGSRCAPAGCPEPAGSRSVQGRHRPGGARKSFGARKKGQGRAADGAGIHSEGAVA